jgi:hypothetical protein
MRNWICDSLVAKERNGSLELLQDTWDVQREQVVPSEPFNSEQELPKWKQAKSVVGISVRRDLERARRDLFIYLARTFYLWLKRLFH